MKITKTCRKKYKKKWLSLLMSVALLAGLLPADSSSAAPSDEPGTVVATQVTMVNLQNAGAAEWVLKKGVSSESTPGASFDPDKGILRLTKGVESLTGDVWLYEFDKTYSNERYAAIYAEGDLIIELANEEAETLIYDGKVYRGDYQPELPYTYGIYVDGNLTIRNAKGHNGNVSFRGTDSYSSTGIRCTGKLTVEGQEGGTLKVEGKGGKASYTNSCGIIVNKGIEVRNAGLTGVSSKASGAADPGSGSIGVTSGVESITVGNGGKLSAHAGDADLYTGYSEGIHTGGITVEQGGEIIAEAGQADESSGIYTTKKNARIAVDGKLKTTGGFTVNGRTCGIYSGSDNTDIIVNNGGILEAAGGDSNQVSYGIYLQGKDAKVTVNNGGTLNSVGGKDYVKEDDEGASYGLYNRYGEVSLESGSDTTISGSDAHNISIGLCVSEKDKLVIEDDAQFSFNSGAAGVSGKAYNACYMQDSDYREITYSLAASAPSGLYPYMTDGEYKLDVISNYISETDWGMEDVELYEYLSSLDKVIKNDYAPGTYVALSKLTGGEYYNVPEDIMKRYDIYAIGQIDTEKILEGKISADEAALHKLNETVRMTKDAGYNLCFVPKTGVTYKRDGAVLDNNSSAGMIIGESAELEYAGAPGSSADDITVMSFTVDSTVTSDVLKAFAKGNDSKTVKTETDEKNHTITIQGVAVGTACIFAASKDVIDQYDHKEISDDEFMDKSGCLFINVSKAKTYTIDANGGRFIKTNLMNQYRDGLITDFADIYDKAEKSLTFNAPEKCTYYELYDYMTKGLTKQGYDINKGMVPFRYGQLQDKTYCLLPHDGVPTKSEPIWKFRSIDNVPSDLDTVYFPYIKNDDCTVRFYDDSGATINWPSGAQIKQIGKTWYYTAPEYSRLSFPEADKEGYIFRGWMKNDYCLIPAGATGIIVSGQSYNAVFTRMIDRIELDGELPNEIKAGEHEGNYTSFGYDGDVSLTIYNEQFHESMEIGEDGEPLSPRVEEFAEDEGHVYYLMVRIEYNGLFDPEKSEVYINGVKVGVDGDGIKLLNCSDKEYFYIIKKYVIGSSGYSYPISFDTGGKAELPESFNTPYYRKGDTPEYILRDKDLETMFNFTYTEDGRTYKAHWYPDKAFREGEEILRTTSLDFDGYITLYADWVEQKHVGSSDINVPVPAPGTYMNVPSDDDPTGDTFNTGWMSGSNGEMSWSCSGIYDDIDLTQAVKDTTIFKAGNTYYAKLSLRANEDKGYSFDNMNLPVVTINNQPVQVEYRIITDEWGDYIGAGYSAAVSFKPRYETCSLTLDYNYPDGTILTHTITDIPVGTELIRGEFSLEDALYIGNMSYDDYLKLANEYKYDGEKAFYAKHKRTEPKEITGYMDYGYGTVKAYSNITEMMGDRKGLYNKAITEDTVLYVTWSRELDRVHLEYLNVPVCGMSVDSYSMPEYYGIKFENGVNSGYYSWMNEEHSDELDVSTSFTGGDKVSLHVQVRLGGEGTDALFDRYITEDTKLSYNGIDYPGEEFTPVKGGGATIEFYIPITVEHAFNSENGTTNIINEESATCENEGSYDEVRSYSCDNCGKSINETLHRTLPALGHDLVRHTLTESVNGITTYWECERCHKLFGDENGKSELTLQATVKKAPKAVKGLSFEFRQMQLITAGEAENGEMCYAFGDDDKTAPEEEWMYSPDIPERHDAGTYYVWYMVKGDGIYANTEPVCITVTIAKMDISNATITFEADELEYNGEQQSPAVTEVSTDLRILNEGEAYEVVSGNYGTEVGTYTYKINGIDNCTGMASATWKIVSSGATPTDDPSDKPAPTTDPGNEPTPPAGNPTNAPSNGTPAPSGNGNGTTPGQNGSNIGNGTGAAPGQNGSSANGSSADGQSGQTSSTKKKIKISKVNRGKNDRSLIVKVSVKGVTIKVKVGKDTYKIKLKKKKNSYTFKLKKPLKNKNKVVVTVTKKGYKKITQKYTYNKKKFKKGK